MTGRPRRIAALCHAVGILKARAEAGGDVGDESLGADEAIAAYSGEFLTDHLSRDTAGEIVRASRDIHSLRVSHTHEGGSEAPSTDGSTSHGNRGEEAGREEGSESDGQDDRGGDSDTDTDTHTRAAASLALARRIAGGSDAPGAEQRDTRPRRLRSVFSTDTREDGEHQEGTDAQSRYRLSPLELSEEVIFPVEADSDTDDDERRARDAGSTEHQRQQYASLWEQMCDAASEAAGFETIVHILEKYTWCVPAPGTDDNRVSLFDYLRTTAAVTEALHRSDLSTTTLVNMARQRVWDGDRSDAQAQLEVEDEEETETETDGEAKPERTDEPLYTLVKGDISGIQRFIHRLRSPDDAQRNIAKRTRGRSVQIWLLNEGLSRLLCSTLDLPPTSILWAGGGQFYALVPSDSETELRRFEQAVNDWLLTQFDGDLLFVQGTADVESPETDFGSLFRRAAHATDQRKLRKGADTFAARDSAILGEATPPCDTCGGDTTGHTADEDRIKCHNCLMQEKIGEALPYSGYVRLDYEARGDDRAHLSIDLGDVGGLSWSLVDNPEAPDASAVFSLNTTSMPDLDPGSGADTGFLFTGAEVPAGGEISDVWSFAELQQVSQGSADAMHVSKLDIDDLGTAIGRRMEGGPAQLAGFSRALELFFSGYVNNIARERALYYGADACPTCRETLEEGDPITIDHEPDDPATVRAGTYHRVPPETAATLHESCVERISPIYVSFSGGDDMLFVGPWDETIEFALDVRDAFADYADATLTLSGGFFLTHPKYPIGRAAEEAEGKMKIAKEYTHSDSRTEDDRKRAAHLFGRTRAWKYEDDTDTGKNTNTQGNTGMKGLLDTGRWLARHIEAEELPRSFLSTLLQIGSQTGPNRRGDGRAAGRLSSTEGDWRIKHELAKHFEGDELVAAEERLTAARPWIEVPVSWASLATR